MNVKDAHFHRNGISGEGFCAAIVTDAFGDGEDRDYLVITLSEGPEYTFVLTLDQLAAGDVASAWRGDQAADACRDAILAKAREGWRAAITN